MKCYRLTQVSKMNYNTNCNIANKTYQKSLHMKIIQNMDVYFLAHAHL